MTSIARLPEAVFVFAEEMSSILGKHGNSREGMLLYVFERGADVHDEIWGLHLRGS